jgi:hypothetical protein
MAKEIFIQALRVLLGYGLAIIVGTVSFLIHLWIVSLILPDSGAWAWLGLGPLVAVVLPVAFLFAAILAATMAWAPALAAALATEFMGWRSPWVYCVLGPAVALIAAFLLNQDFLNAPSTDMLLVSACYALAAVWAGLVYWGVAGKRAGAWRGVAPPTG